jgi:O-antigen/teichoic acid export membrane protein
MISTLINASIPFLLLPILTKYLSKSDMGYIFMFSTLTTFLTPLVNVNMDGAITRVFYKDKNTINQYIANCISISIVTTILISILCYLFEPTIFEYTGLSFKWVFLCIITCFAQFQVLILLTLYRVNIKPISFGILQNVSSLINLILSILLIVFLNFNWEGRVLGISISTIIVSIFSYIILQLKYKINFKIKPEYIKHALVFGSGLIPHTIGMALILLTNRFFLMKMLSIEETGLFGDASMLASIISFISFSFNNAYVPWLYEKLNKRSAYERLKLVWFTYKFYFALVIFGLVFYFILPIVFHIFINEKFVLALKYIPWLIVGFIFQGMYLMVTNYIIYSEKTHLQAIVTIVVGLLNVPLTYFSVLYYKSEGAAFAFGLSFMLLFVFTWFISSKVYKMPWFLIFKVSKNLIK